MFKDVKRVGGERHYINLTHVIDVAEELVVPDPIIQDGEAVVLYRAVVLLTDGSKLALEMDDWKVLKKQIETEQRKR